MANDGFSIDEHLSELYDKSIRSAIIRNLQDDALTCIKIMAQSTVGISDAYKVARILDYIKTMEALIEAREKDWNKL